MGKPEPTQHATASPFQSSFKENIDFYYNEAGEMVLTKKYLLKRGHCCHSDCLHCPYPEEERGDPSIPLELQRQYQAHEEEEEELYKYFDYDPDKDKES